MVGSHTSASELLGREAFSSALVDILDALVVVLDREGRILLFNRACERTTGLAAQAVLGRPFWDVVIPADERAAIREGFGRLTVGMFPSHHENDWVTAAGQSRRIAWSNTCMTDSAGRVAAVLATGFDVTAMRTLESERETVKGLAQAEASRAQRWLELIAAVGKELAESLSVDMSLQRTASLLVPVVVDCCAFFAQADNQDEVLLAGVHAEPARSPALQTSLLGLHDDGEPAGVRRVLQSGREERWALPDTHALGLKTVVCMPMLAHGRVAGAMVLGLNRRDLAAGERMLLEDVARRCALLVENTRLLQRSQDSLLRMTKARAQTDMLMRTAPVGLALLDTDLRYLSINEMLAQLHDSTPERDIGRRVSEVVPDAAAIIEPLMRGVLSTRQPVIGREIQARIPRRSAAPGDFITSYYPVETATGELVGLGVVVVDVTEQRRAEREHAQLEAQLQQAQRLDSLGHLAGGIAHDFNNLLVAIRTSADLLDLNLGQAPTNDDTRELIEVVRLASDRAGELTRNILAFARGGAPHEELLDLNELLPRILGLLRRMIRENVAMPFSPAPEPALIRGDRSQLQQVVTNLYVNAAEAIGEGGWIALDVELTTLDATALLGFPWARPGRYVHIAVKDGGAGMSAEVQARIFEPFFTTKAPGKGTGLGLSIVYGIVKQWGGVVRVASRVGQGSSFDIYLPAVTGTTVPSAVPPAAVSGGGQTVLVVEDNDLVASSVRRLLERHGYGVLVAPDGEQACRIFDRHRDDLHLVILDAVLPRMSGHAVYEYIRARAPSLPVLVTSGHTADVFPQAFFREQGVAFVAKPYEIGQLLGAIQEALARSLIRPH